jgi:chromosome transmission fidelity protein 18
LWKIKLAQDLIEHRSSSQISQNNQKAALVSPKVATKISQVKIPDSNKNTYDPSQRTIQLEDLVPSKVISAKPVRDFFGRIVESKKVEIEEHATNVDIENRKVKESTGASSNVLFKFKEGYSNAVRKPLYVRDLKM